MTAHHSISPFASPLKRLAKAGGGKGVATGLEMQMLRVKDNR